jgi:hypothetical protein
MYYTTLTDPLRGHFSKILRKSVQSRRSQVFGGPSSQLNLILTDQQNHLTCKISAYSPLYQFFNDMDRNVLGMGVPRPAPCMVMVDAGAFLVGRTSRRTINNSRTLIEHLCYSCQTPSTLHLDCELVSPETPSNPIRSIPDGYPPEQLERSRHEEWQRLQRRKCGGRPIGFNLFRYMCWHKERGSYRKQCGKVDIII